jgi:hypothetical protein
VIVWTGAPGHRGAASILAGHRAQPWRGLAAAAPGVRHFPIRESLSYQPLRFGLLLLYRGLSPANPAALNSRGAMGSRGEGCKLDHAHLQASEELSYDGSA